MHKTGNEQQGQTYLGKMSKNHGTYNHIGIIIFHGLQRQLLCECIVGTI